ncbi:hypothetical protein ABD76_26290 [Paenibacillus dendritiformis]|uniref:hypothetical protein n=1 Tax=Paenibacillus dendritiformis TaxID=130049 RepID=UPI001A7F0BF4|nr:hypothetical protein [Paenibacillus dendritiformis]MBG9795772.1 hypothetical protein [Paenibacillus dendritiformis]
MTGKNQILSNGEIAHKSLKDLFASGLRAEISDVAALEKIVFLRDLFKQAKSFTGSTICCSRQRYSPNTSMERFHSYKVKRTGKIQILSNGETAHKNLKTSIRMPVREME